MSEPPGLGRAVLVLLRLRLRRFVNKFSSAFRRRRKGKGRAPRRTRAAALSKRSTPKGRAATAGKRGHGCVGAVVLGALMLLSIGNMAWMGFQRMEDALARPRAAASKDDGAASDPERRVSRAVDELTERVSAAPGVKRRVAGELLIAPAVARGVSFIFILLLAATLLLMVATKEISRPEWDLEWLVTFPVPLSGVLAMKVVERTCLSVHGIVFMWPLSSVVAWECGARWTAPLLGLAAALALIYMAVVASMVIEGFLRFSLSPSRLRNLQALFSIFGLVLMYVAMAGLMGGERDADYFVFRWMRALPAWAEWLPTGLAVRVLASRGAAGSAACFGLIALYAAAVTAAGFFLLEWRLKGGVVTGGVRESVRAAGTPGSPSAGESAVRGTEGAARPAGAPSRTRAAEEGCRVRERIVLAPVQAKELRLLGRDRNFLAQTLVVPALIVGAQVMFNPGILRSASKDCRHLGALAFGLGAYALMFSAFQVLNAEGPALWLVYTLPHRLEKIVLRKAALWAVLASLFPAGILAGGFIASGSFPLDGYPTVALVLAGMPVCAVIAASLGIFGSNPLEENPQRRVRPDFLYLYMLLAGLYAFAIYAPGFWQKLGVLALATLLALALWQKARDRLPYLLDPTASPPAQVSLADGLIAAQVFFVIQALLFLAFVGAGGMPLVEAVTWAFVIAGGVTFAAVRFTFWRHGVKGIPRFFGKNPTKALVLGSLLGLVSAGTAFGYLALVSRVDALAEEAERATATQLEPGPALFALVVLAAPLFEEFIFRGLVYGGMRRTMKVWTSVLASAAIFALVHPPISAAPVFVMGACAALAYERTKLLVAPLAAHAVYNAVVVGMSLAF